MMRCIEDRGHSCRGTTATRLDWCEGLDVKLISQDKDVDVLYWVGCAAALEDRNMKVSAAFARVLQAAGINFAILGEEESCCGEPARRLGNEYLFQMQAQKNIELLKSYGVKKIVTACPHCFNTLKNEYPQFGGEFEVIHHSEFIADLISNGKLKPIMMVNKKVTYQDPCYLIRHNDIYEAPRNILTSLPMLKFTEMERERDIFNILRDILLSIPMFKFAEQVDGFRYIGSEWYLKETMRGKATQWIKERIRDSIFYAPPVQALMKYDRKKKSFCCGGGGGRMWLEERIGTRINEMRTDHAIATKANIVATACPYCLQMFEDGIKAKEATEYLKAMDIAELVASAIH
jgi:Fe-S oxidoreductase